MIEQTDNAVLAQHIKVVGWNPTYTRPQPAQPVYDNDEIVGFIADVNEFTIDVVLFEQREFNQRERPSMVVISPQMTLDETQDKLANALTKNQEMIDFWVYVLQGYTDNE